MKLIDANLLLYAYHPKSERHDISRTWIESTFSGEEPVRLAWITVFAFLRIITSPRIFDRPLSMAEAERIVATWFALPAVAAIEPGDRYWDIFRDLLEAGQVSGALVMDAALAALAIEHGATLCTADRDFARFANLKTLDPLDRTSASHP